MGERASGMPRRLLIVCPSWIGDAVMATPAVRLVRERLPGAFIGALVRPGIDEVLSGAGFFDEVHVERAQGVMGPKRAAGKVRPRRYDAALLLTNSFSTALTVRMAGIPRRIGFDRDGRGLLLTERLKAPKRADGEWAIVAAANYYWAAATAMLDGSSEWDLPAGRFLELAATDDDRRRAAVILEGEGVSPGSRYAILNPGGNNPAKRWPAQRFGAVARHMALHHGLKVLINAAPGEREVAMAVEAAAEGAAIDLSGSGGTLGSLKALVAESAIMVTNDTGPRHIAAAFGVPLVSLFGPTDHRWTSIPTRPGGREAVVVADPTLPEDQSANDHPERCSIERIELEGVIDAVERVLARS